MSYTSNLGLLESHTLMQIPSRDRSGSLIMASTIRSQKGFRGLPCTLGLILW